MTDVDDDLQVIAAAVQVLARTLRRAGEAEEDVEPLPGSEFDVLYFVGTHPGSSVSEVARRLGLQTSNVSTAVRSLVERGLIDRAPDPLDQRRSRLTASAQARQRRTRIETVWSGTLARLLDQLDEPDAARLLAAAPALHQVAALISAELHGGWPVQRPIRPAGHGALLRPGQPPRPI